MYLLLTIISSNVCCITRLSGRLIDGEKLTNGVPWGVYYITSRPWDQPLKPARGRQCNARWGPTGHRMVITRVTSLQPGRQLGICVVAQHGNSRKVLVLASSEVFSQARLGLERGFASSKVSNVSGKSQPLIENTSKFPVSRSVTSSKTIF